MKRFITTRVVTVVERGWIDADDAKEAEKMLSASSPDETYYTTIECSVVGVPHITVLEMCE
jgi:hypothetical protein